MSRRVRTYDDTGADKIVTGSLNGIVRIYAPRRDKGDVEHLLLEQSVG